MSASETIVNWFLQQGATGVFCLMLMASIVYLWRKLEKKEEHIQKLQEDLKEQGRECSDQALELQGKVFAQQGQFNAVIDKLTESLELLKEVLVKGKR